MNRGTDEIRCRPALRLLRDLRVARGQTIAVRVETGPERGGRTVFASAAVFLKETLSLVGISYVLLKS